MAQEKEYFAFISYKREDEKWAKWLANELEHYHLPTTLNGKDLPKNLRPVFRDVDELAAGNLPKQIYHALSNSKNLIVICSPRSAKSEWVDKEIDDFIKIKGRKADNIYPFIIDGIPFSKDADKECFPEKLRNLPESEERLGGNINDQGGRSAAVVKIIAGMLGIGFDSLWQKYEREQRKRRYMVIAASLLFSLMSLGITGWMIYKDWEMMKIQSRTVADQANALIDQGDSYTARRILLEVLPKDWHWKYWPNRPYTLEAEAALRKACKRNNAIWKSSTARSETHYIAFSPDNKKIVTASDDGYLRVFDSSTGICCDSLKARTDAFEFSKDGNIVTFVPYHSNVICNWTINGKIDTIQFNKGHNINKIQYYSNNNIIVSFSSDSIFLWNVSKGICLFSLPYNHKINVSFSLGENGNRFVLQNGRTLQIGNIKSKQIIKKTYNIIDWMGSIAISPDEKWICFNANKDIIILDAITGEKCHTLTGHTECINSVVFSKDSKMIVSSSDDGTIRLWNTLSGNSIKELDKGRDYYKKIKYATINSIKDKVVSASLNGEIRLWDLESQKSSIQLRGEYGYHFKISPNGKKIATMSKKAILVWDFQTEQLDTFSINNEVKSICFHPDSNEIASCDESLIRIWDLQTKKCKKILSGGVNNSYISFSPDGKRIISTVSGAGFIIWDIEREKRIDTIEGFMYDAQYLPNGKVITEANDALRIEDNFIDIYKIMKRPLGLVHFSFSKDGKYIAISLANGYVAIWDLSDSCCINIIKVTNDIINTAYFSKDNEYLVTVSSAKHIKIWDWKNIFCLYEDEWDNKIREAQFSPTDNIFFVNSDKGINIIDFPPLQQLIDETRKRFKNRPLTSEERHKYYLE